MKGRTHFLSVLGDKLKFPMGKKKFANQVDLKVAVIGAGAAGLCAAKHLKSQGVAVTVFEAWRQNNFDSAPAG